MRSTNKHVLFARQTRDGKTHLWPVAVFNTDVLAKTHAAYLKMAYSNKDVDQVKHLDPQTALTDKGELHPAPKLSLKELPYNPTPAAINIDSALDADS